VSYYIYDGITLFPEILIMFTAKDNPIYNELGNVNPKAIIYPEFNQAFVGLGVNISKTVAVYDWNTCVTIAVNEHDMKPSEAREFLFFDVVQQNTNDNAPIFLHQSNPMREIEQLFFPDA